MQTVTVKRFHPDDPDQDEPVDVGVQCFHRAGPWAVVLSEAQKANPGFSVTHWPSGRHVWPMVAGECPLTVARGMAELLNTVWTWEGVQISPRELGIIRTIVGGGVS